MTSIDRPHRIASVGKNGFPHTCTHDYRNALDDIPAFLHMRNGSADADHYLQFLGGPSDGSFPLTAASLAIGSNGVLYGATGNGGNGLGTIFSLTLPVIPGVSWTDTVYIFPDDEAGYAPNAVVLGHGSLYGTTYSGGTSGQGNVFSLRASTTPGDCPTETVLAAAFSPSTPAAATDLIR